MPNKKIVGLLIIFLSLLTFLLGLAQEDKLLEKRISEMQKAIKWMMKQYENAKKQKVDIPEKIQLFPIKCRGGNVPVTIIVNISNEIEGFLKPRTYTPFARLKFKRGKKAAGIDGQGLLPGECSWVDRGMNNDEPTEILFYGFDTQIVFTPQTGREGGYQIDFYNRSSKKDKSYQWHKNFFQEFSNPNFITEFWVTKKDGFLICGDESRLYFR